MDSREGLYQKFVDDVKAGLSFEDICVKYADVYKSQRGGKINKSSVAHAIKTHDPQAYADYREKQRQQVLELDRQGKSYDEISKAVGLTKADVGQFIRGTYGPETEAGIVSMDDVRSYINGIRAGDVVKAYIYTEYEDSAGQIREGKFPRSVKIIRIYPEVVETDKGCIRCADLYIGHMQFLKKGAWNV